MGKIIRKCIEHGGSSNYAENINYDDNKNVKEAISEKTNLYVSETQPENLTTADLWFRVTGTIK